MTCAGGPDTPIWKMEASLRYRHCTEAAPNSRCKPAANIVRLRREKMLREQAGAADLSQPRVIGWQVVTQSPAWLAAATFPLRSETRDEYCAFDITKLVQLTAGFERALGYEF
jgi:hypothetical protein